jgi:hypothetical protein
MLWPKNKLQRFVINTIVVWPMLGVYLFINHHQAPPPNTLLMPAWVPFWPAFFPIYISMLFVTWLLPVAISNPEHFRAYLRANVCAFLLVMPWWILSPTVLPRPPLPDGAWSYVFDFLWKTDQPYNVRPCAHGIGPIIAAWFFVQERPRWRWVLGATLVVGLSSIAFTWQHRPTDILLGTIATAIGIAIATTLSRREQSKLSIAQTPKVISR